jgi:hypothetical protein
VGLTLGLMLNNFLCHGTKTNFCKLFHKKGHLVADKIFLKVVVLSDFYYVCGLPLGLAEEFSFL